MMKTNEWTDVTGGKTKSKFYRSFDEKYVFKEVKRAEFKMFMEFAPSYFDYLCKSFFHSYPCTLCKILGAYKLKMVHTSENSNSKQI
jgi:1-phosphatidylinositol-3-phosphate 5-kinase